MSAEDVPKDLGLRLFDVVADDIVLSWETCPVPVGLDGVGIAESALIGIDISGIISTGTPGQVNINVIGASPELVHIPDEGMSHPSVEVGAGPKTVEEPD